MTKNSINVYSNSATFIEELEWTLELYYEIHLVFHLPLQGHEKSISTYVFYLSSSSTYTMLLGSFTEW